MRIDTTGLHPNRTTRHDSSEAAGRPVANAARESGGDHITVSSRARLLALGRNALEAAPAIRMEAVEAARERLSAGADVYDGLQIARAMTAAITEETSPSDPSSIAAQAGDTE